MTPDATPTPQIENYTLKFSENAYDPIMAVPARDFNGKDADFTQNPTKENPMDIWLYLPADHFRIWVIDKETGEKIPFCKEIEG